MVHTVEENKLILRREMDRQNITNPETRAGIAAITIGESGFEMEPELGYAHTSNQRIRGVFGSRVSALSDAQLNELKVDPQTFFNRVYGGEWGKKNLGNTDPDDGYTFRGRGPIQLTGRTNYAYVGARIGVDLIHNPDAVLDSYIGCAATVAYIKWRYKGGGWERLKDSVGNNTPDIAATKDAAYRRYLASGEFGPVTDQEDGGAVDGPSVVPEQPQATPNLDRIKKIQEILRPEYAGAIDGLSGNRTRDALQVVGQKAGQEYRK